MLNHVLRRFLGLLSVVMHVFLHFEQRLFLVALRSRAVLRRLYFWQFPLQTPMPHLWWLRALLERVGLSHYHLPASILPSWLHLETRFQIWKSFLNSRTLLWLLYLFLPEGKFLGQLLPQLCD